MDVNNNVQACNRGQFVCFISFFVLFCFLMGYFKNYYYYCCSFCFFGGFCLVLDGVFVVFGGHGLFVVLLKLEDVLRFARMYVCMYVLMYDYVYVLFVCRV